MKQNWKGWLHLGVTLFGLYLAIHYWDPFSHLVLLVIQAATPLLLGAVIAYAVNILMELFERHFFPDTDHPVLSRARRPVCLLLAYASLAALVFLIVRMILPELVQCVGLLIQQAAPLVEQLGLALNKNLDLSQLLSTYSVVLSDGTLNWQEALSAAIKWLGQGLGGVMGSMISLFSSLFSAVFTLVISLIFSIYLLLGKERLGRQCGLVLHTYLKPAWYSGLMYFLKTLHGCFHRFVVGQCTEAVILGLLCMVGMLALGFPYATMIGTLIGFTALIPVAGAYIGAGVGAFMIFTVSPVKSLLFLVFIIVLQQLEGNLIYPKVVGASIGLPGIWVLASVTVGGGMLGIFGMLLAVPLVAAFYQMIRRDVHGRNSPPPVQQPVSSPDSVIDGPKEE